MAGPRSASAVWTDRSAREAVKNKFLDIVETIREAGPRSTSAPWIVASAWEAVKIEFLDV